jgi:SAM-dependent methyltransferase
MINNWNRYWGDETNRSYWLEPDKAVIELLDKIERCKVKKVLDLGCGAGRHALLFAKAGFEVTAVDSSREALSVLRNQVQKEGLSMKIIEGNYSQDLFFSGTFDFVLAFNVLYHGYREDFREAVNLTHRWLKPGGLFFFTCPTRRDDKYGNGEEVAPNTYRPLNSIHPGDIHYFSDETDISDLLRDFKQVSINIEEHYWDNNGTQQLSSYRQVLVVSYAIINIDTA